MVNPPIEWPNGTKYWYVNGHLHRTDGPAIEYADGHEEWYFNNNEYTFDVWLKVNTALTHGEKVMMKLQYG
jgi:hypothetical protein